MSILIKNVEVNGQRADIAVEGNRIQTIAPNIHGTYDDVIDGSSQLAAPPFYNTHTHAAMTLLRGYADDMELMDWLNNHIWPAEAKLGAEDIYWGTRLACLEMIRSGTVFFSDMYFFPHEIARAVEDCGMRAAIGLTILESSPKRELHRQHNLEILRRKKELSSRIQLSIAPHAIYTVSDKGLKMAAELAESENLTLNIHVAETAVEVSQCKEAHHGMTPVEYLSSLGVLSSRTIAAHSVHLTEHDIQLYREHGVVSAFNPVSNMKLCSGIFQFRRLVDAGCRVTLGTDGASSNNNLSMFDEMKTAALVAKLGHGGPLGATSEEIFHCATQSGAEAFGIDAGLIAPGRLADIVLYDLDNPLMTPSFNAVSNLVYSADSSCVATVICDGRVIMRDHIIPWAEETIAHARECAGKLRG
ncbi:MAG: amidohydrolase [Victivallales bacterium]|nr:amidohydrolase [Victivallales bacterium]